MGIYRLSKSKILSGLQCGKRLYLEVHQPEMRQDSRTTEALSAMGHRLGQVARALVPEGLLVTMQNGPVGAAIKDHLEHLPYPRFYLDVETIASAVPIWAGTRPYPPHLPFQWSLHVEPAPGALEHRAFTDLSGENSMRRLAEAFLAALGESGPIFVYSSFERTVLQQLAALHPDLALRLQAAIARLEDLLPLMRAHFYHPDMKGFWSTKALLPTVALALEYEALEEVRDGRDAQAAYLEACSLAEGTPRHAARRRHLLAYCQRDTRAWSSGSIFFPARTHFNKARATRLSVKIASVKGSGLQ